MPSSPSAAASRIGATDLDRLSVDLERAGLTLPPRILVMLIGCCGVGDASSYRDESDRLLVVRLTFAMSVGSIACQTAIFIRALLASAWFVPVRPEPIFMGPCEER
jgi:hypothetical protein